MYRLTEQEQTVAERIVLAVKLYEKGWFSTTEFAHLLQSIVDILLGKDK